MDGFTYSNIFETKGIEYIIVIFFLLILIPFWILVNRQVPLSKKIKQTINVLTSAVLKIPQGLFFSKNHTWTYLETTGSAKIGIDDFLLKVVGKIQIVPQKNAGDNVKKGDVLAEINQDGKLLKVISPISGEVLAAKIPENFTNISDRDPYDNWFYDIKPSNWKVETSGLFLADEATKWVSEELERLKDFLTVSLARYSGDPSLVVLQEGGELPLYPLTELKKEIWDDFQHEFLE